MQVPTATPKCLQQDFDEEAGRKQRGTTSEELVRRRGNHTLEKQSSNGKLKRRGGYQFKLLPMLAACTMVFGPFGTILTFMLLPDDHSWRLRQEQLSDGQQGMPSLEHRGHMRLLHLRLAGTDVNARFVIDERSNWEGFIAGCTERLRIEGVARVTDTSEEAIPLLEKARRRDPGPAAN